MATSKAYDLSNLWDGIDNGAKWDAGVVFNRTNALPLDKFSVFKSFADAYDYAQNNAVAYPGQIITVVDGTLSTVTAYKIETDGQLCAVSPKIDVHDLPISAGTGIEITDAGYVNAKVGAGLCVDLSNNITVAAGNGLSIVNNTIAIGALLLDGGNAFGDNPDTILTRVKYMASSGLPDWEGDIVGELTESSIPDYI